MARLIDLMFRCPCGKEDTALTAQRDMGKYILAIDAVEGTAISFQCEQCKNIFKLYVREHPNTVTKEK